MKKPHETPAIGVLLGHQQTAIQTLPKTLGVSAQTVIVLDALRKQRNASDYEGDPVSGKGLDS